MMQRLDLLLIAGTLPLAASASAQSPDAPRAVAASGMAIPDASIAIVPVGRRFYSLLSTAGDPSDRSGSWSSEVPKLPDDHHVYLVWKAGFRPRCFLELPPVARLVPGATFQVACKTVDGEPLQGARVVLSRVPFFPQLDDVLDPAPWVGGGDPRCAVHAAVSGADGSTVLDMLPPGQFVFDVWHPTHIVVAGLPEHLRVRVPCHKLELSFQPISGIAVSVDGDTILATPVVASWGNSSGPLGQMTSGLGAASILARSSVSADIVQALVRKPGHQHVLRMFLRERAWVEARVAPTLLANVEKLTLDATELGRTVPTGRLLVETVFPSGRRNTRLPTGPPYSRASVSELLLCTDGFGRVTGIPVTPGTEMVVPAGDYAIRPYPKTSTARAIAERPVHVAPGELTRAELAMSEELLPCTVRLVAPWNGSPPPAVVTVEDAHGATRRDFRRDGSDLSCLLPVGSVKVSVDAAGMRPVAEVFEVRPPGDDGPQILSIRMRFADDG